ncbi:unnamed protein product [Didymodactylos carnosus]|uniref:Uncharacterized protein n=1 Tax=Didymodactylos carnosus TaxID=1234261 RepID=A0A8S2E9P9_9BILA|nr:unnamed protein product [Didymodactylos carnosus]CAF3953064.1 unnamed protein product [Didymodactylos carnosus]
MESVFSATTSRSSSFCHSRPSSLTPIPKRFRPVEPCRYIDPIDSVPCTSEAFLPCVCCDEYVCLEHMLEHQNLVKVERDKLLEKANETYVKLSAIELVDNRTKLYAPLSKWKIDVTEKLQKIYDEKFHEINQLYEEMGNEFEAKKNKYLTHFNEQLLHQMNKLSNKKDFYPTDLDQFRENLFEFDKHIEDELIIASTSATQSIELQFNHANEFDMRLIRRKQVSIDDLEITLNSPCVRQFKISIGPNNCVPVYDSSMTYMLACYESEIKLYENDKQTVEIKWNNEDRGSVVCTLWSELRHEFLILANNALYAFNCLIQPYHSYKLDQIKQIEGKIMRWLTNVGDNLFINHGLGAYLEHWSITNTTFQLIKRWTIADLYDNDKNEINRIQLNDQQYLAMNVYLEQDDEDVLDFVDISAMTKLRRFRSCYCLMNINSTDNQWLIKHVDLNSNSNKSSLCLIDTMINGDLKKLNLHDDRSSNDVCVCFQLGKNMIVLGKRDFNGYMLMEFYQIKF